MTPRLTLASGALILALLAGGCAHYVVVEDPPAVNLREFTTIGVVQFACEKEPLAQNVTQRFIATMQNAQPGVRVQRLGPAADVLATVGGTSFDAATLQKIGAHWKVDAIIVGELKVSKPRPQVRVGVNLDSLSADMNVDGDLTASLHPAADGSLLWTNGAHGTWTLGGAGVGNGLRVGVSDPVQRYHQMLGELVEVTTREFRTTWRRQRVD
ncbi:MAG: hypothetical protein P1V51_17580 [Deltaproteobacteria bacterium]|nr:hypothetical protein [Deltaproteobacteria bacterium]